jgi:peptidoglycan/LPS O-acetylase OafA/YrhL
MSAAPQKNSRFDSIDVVRGLAAVMVILQHSLESVSPGFVRFGLDVFDFGLFGVTAFLLVSGFVIPVSLERGGSNRVFWISRFFRLYPLYWFSLLIPAVAAVFAHHSLNGPFKIDQAWHWVANVTMLQQFVGVPHAMGLYWTLTIEMALYALCSVLFAFGRLKDSMLIAWIGLGAGTLGAVVLPLLLHRRVPGGYILLMLTTLVGTVIYRSVKGTIPKLAATQVIVAFGVLTLASGIINFAEPMPNSASLLSLVLSISLAYGVFMLAVGQIGKPMPSGLVTLGRISYSTYLMHPLFLWLMPTSLGIVGYPLAVLVATIALANLTYRWIEEPTMAWGKRISSRVSLRTPANV